LHWLWFEGSCLHKDYPEKGNASSSPTFYSCQMAERQAAHSSNFWAAGMRRKRWKERKSQRTPRLRLDGCYPQILQRQLCHYLLHLHEDAVASLIDSEPSKIVPTRKRSVTQSVMAPNAVSWQHVDSSSRRTADYGRVSNGNYKSCFKYHEAKWPQEFMEPAES
jgi:hypothetical protein